MVSRYSPRAVILNSQDMSELLTNESKTSPQATSLPPHTRSILGVFGKNTMWLMVDRVALRMGTAVAGLVLVGYLGPTNFGIYSTAIAIGTLVNVALDLGLTRYSARTVAANPGEGPRILALTLFTTSLSAIIEFAGLLFFLSRGNIYAACITAGLILCNLDGTGLLCSAMLTADLRSRAVIPGSVLGALGLIVVIVLVIGLRLSVFALLVGASLRSLLVVVLRMWQLRDYWPSRRHWTWTEFCSLVRSAWPFFSYTFTQIGYEKVPVVCLGLVATQEQVGLFSAATVVAYVFPMWSYASTDALLPLLTRLYEQKRIHELLELRQRLLDVYLFVSVPVVVLLSVFAPEICLLFGSRFVSSAPVLRIVAIRSLLSVLDAYLGQAFLTATNHVKERRNAQAMALIALGGLTLALGHFWGSKGGGIALIVADTLLILQYVLILSAVGLPLRWPALGPTLIGGAAMALTGLELPARINWFLKPIPALLVYLAVLTLVARSKLAQAGRTLLDCLPGRC